MTVVFRNTDSFKSQVTKAFVDFLTSTGSSFPEENVLHNYRTFNYVVTLGIVSKDEFKNGTYRTKGLDYIVFQSHGKPLADFGRSKPKGGSSTLGTISNIIQSVSELDYDFFLQEFYIKNAITKNRDIGTEFRLKILEPYGIETFLTSIYRGLKVKGYEAVGKGSAFVIKLEFVGYRDDKEEPEVIPFSTRHYPIIISEIKADLSKEGTVYQIKGAPLNDMGRYNDVNEIPQDINITGKTVGEMFKDLETKINAIIKTQAAESKFIPNEYKIEFFDFGDKGGVVEKISTSEMYNPDTDAGHRGYEIPKGTNNKYLFGSLNERVAPAENRQLTFTVNGKKGISKVIDDIIVDSMYVVSNILNNWRSGYDDKGMVEWWRVIPKVEILEFDNGKNMPAFRVIYQIVPRKVPWQKLASIFFPDTKAEVSDYEPFTVRRYDWSYTGKNKDILNFRLNLDYLLTRILSRNFGSSPGIPGQESAVTGEGVVVPKFSNVDSGPSDAETNSGNQTRESTAQSSDVGVRSSTETNPAFNMARDIFSAINSPFENSTFEMEILGDPMWLGTQFIDNISFVDPAKSALFTNDGGIAFRTIDPCVRVLAYGPKDFNADGFLAVGDSTQQRLLATWSGYFIVTHVESYFMDGTFRQKLSGYRLTRTDMKRLSKNIEELKNGIGK
jgi:hypothetical protein